eukprot:5947332-Prymnesium_polylepis.1
MSQVRRRRCAAWPLCGGVGVPHGPLCGGVGVPHGPLCGGGGVPHGPLCGGDGVPRGRCAAAAVCCAVLAWRGDGWAGWRRAHTCRTPKYSERVQHMPTLQRADGDPLLSTLRPRLSAARRAASGRWRCCTTPSARRPSPPSARARAAESKPAP